MKAIACCGRWNGAARGVGAGRLVASGWWLAVAVPVHRDECRAITRVSGSQRVAHTHRVQLQAAHALVSTSRLARQPGLSHPFGSGTASGSGFLS